MLKKMLLIALVLSFTVAAVHIIIFSFINEKRYNDVILQYVSDNITKDSDGFGEKIRLLRIFTHENVHPVAGEESRPDTVGVDKLITGIGWCDQVSRTFMQLAQKSGVTSRLLFLQHENGSSPHTIAEVFDGKRWVLVDAAYNIEFVNNDGNMASMADIRDDINIINTNNRVRLFAANSPWWRDKRNLNIYYRDPSYINTKEGEFNFLIKYLPGPAKKAMVNMVQNMYLIKNKDNFDNSYDYAYFVARNYHLAGRTAKAEPLYIDLVSKFGNSNTADRARFFLALLYKEETRYDDAIKVLSDLIANCNNNGWIPYAYGLRAQIYNILGQEEKFSRDLAKVGNNIDAYF